MADGDLADRLRAAPRPSSASNIGPAAARLAVTPDGRATIQLAGHEIGTGAYTTVGLTVAHSLGLELAKVTVVMGDSDLPPVLLAGGALLGAASTTHVAAWACVDDARQRPRCPPRSPTRNRPFALTDPAKLVLVAEHIADQRWLSRAKLLAKALGRVTSGVLEVHAENLASRLAGSPAAPGRPLQGPSGHVARRQATEDATGLRLRRHPGGDAGASAAPVKSARPGSLAPSPPARSSIH